MGITRHSACNENKSDYLALQDLQILLSRESITRPCILAAVLMLTSPMVYTNYRNQEPQWLQYDITTTVVATTYHKDK